MVSVCVLAPDRAVLVRALFEDTVLCFLGKTLDSHGVSIQKYSVTGRIFNLILGV